MVAFRLHSRLMRCCISVSSINDGVLHCGLTIKVLLDMFFGGSSHSFHYGVFYPFPPHFKQTTDRPEQQPRVLLELCNVGPDRLM